MHRRYGTTEQQDRANLVTNLEDRRRNQGGFVLAHVVHAYCSTSQPTRPSRRPLIEVEQPASPRTAPYATGLVDHRGSIDEAIAESLVVPLAVIVLDKLRHGAPEMALT